MSVARVALAITLTASDDCTDITVTDSTGSYPTAIAGYGLPTGATSASVTTCTIVVTLSDGSYFTYVFTISSGTITAATLSLSGGTATVITSSLDSTVFPLVAFELFENYGVNLPTCGDGIYKVDYTIQGRIDPVSPDTAYAYTASSAVLLSCSLCCCLKTKIAEISTDCDCFDTKMMAYLRANMYLKLAIYAMNVGKTADAITNFNNAVDLCNADCSC